MPFDNLSEQSVQYLQKLVEAVSGLAPQRVESWEFSLEPYRKGHVPQLIADVKRWAGKGTFLYVFSVPEKRQLAQMSQEFALAKAQGRGGRAFSRLNTPCRTIYVGSSANIATRIRQHLGYGPRKTYSMHLAHWAPPRFRSFRLQCAEYEVEVQPEALQTLENQLWDQLQPMFGRRGQR